MNRKLLIAILISILACVIILFITGSSILTKGIIGIPLGNIIVWLGFIALQFLIFILNNGFKKSKSIIGKIVRFLMIALIVISILWLAIAFLISGNVNFDFKSTATGFVGSPKASILHWYIIYTLIIAPIILMIIYRIISFFEIKK